MRHLPVNNYFVIRLVVRIKTWEQRKYLRSTNKMAMKRLNKVGRYSFVDSNFIYKVSTIVNT